MIAHGLIEWLTVYHCIKRLSDVKIDEVHAYESTKLKLELWPMFILVDSNPRRRKRYRFLDDASYTPFANSRVPTFLLKKNLKRLIKEKKLFLSERLIKDWILARIKHQHIKQGETIEVIEKVYVKDFLNHDCILYLCKFVETKDSNKLNECIILLDKELCLFNIEV